MSVVSRMDQAVNAFVARCAWFHQPMTRGRARMFALQHRLNTRQRNSVLKLKVATNCSDWDTRMRIIQACSEEVIADHEHGGGRPHWKILEDLGLRIGLKRRELQDAQPLPSTELAWAAWEGLMANRHWLEGIVANTCAEGLNVPGYGSGLFRKHGWFGIPRPRWGKLFGLAEAELEVFAPQTRADNAHSDTGWRAGGRRGPRDGCPWQVARDGMPTTSPNGCEQRPSDPVRPRALVTSLGENAFFVGGVQWQPVHTPAEFPESGKRATPPLHYASG